MNIIGREEQLQELNRICDNKEFACVALYGRRRVGKSALLREFTKDKIWIWCTGTEITGEENLASLGRAVLRPRFGHDTEGVKFKDIIEVFEYVASMSRDVRTVLVIDGYPEFSASISGLSKQLREIIDEKLVNTRLMLILCTTYAQFNEDKYFGAKLEEYPSWLTHMELKPLSFSVVREILKFYPIREAAMIYGATGGVPAYLELVEPEISAVTNIKNMFVGGTYPPLMEEPAVLLREEVREPEYYSAIMRSMARGCKKNSEIASAVGLQTSAATAYLKKLISFGYVERRSPNLDEEGRKSSYFVSDNMMGLWHGLVPPNISLIGEENSQEDLEIKCKAAVENIMRESFVQICSQWLIKENNAGRLPIISEGNDEEGGGFSSLNRESDIDTFKRWLIKEKSEGSLPLKLSEITRWWGDGGRKGSDIHFDIFAEHGEEYAVIGECIWNNEPIGVDTIERLLAHVEQFNHRKKYIFIFSKESYTEEGMEAIANQKNIIPIRIDIMQ